MNRWVLFDLDGTLTNPQVGITQCITYAMEKLRRVAPPLEDLNWCIGPPLRGSFCTLVGEELADEAMTWYRERFGRIGLFENELYPGIVDALNEIRAMGFRLAVATSKPRVFAVQIAAHFGLDACFEALYGSELDGRLSDKGELIAHVLAEQQIDSDSAVMVGDRRHDVLGAHQNKIPAIGVLYGFGSRTELEEAGADILCSSPDEIPLAVSRLAGA